MLKINIIILANAYTLNSAVKMKRINAAKNVKSLIFSVRISNVTASLENGLAISFQNKSTFAIQARKYNSGLLFQIN